MVRVAVAQLGARNHYALPRVLYAAGALERFYTDSYAGNKPRLRRLVSALPQSLLPAMARRWVGRTAPGLPPERVTSFERLGWQAARSLALAETKDDSQVVWAEMNRKFGEWVAAADPGGAAIWGINTASLELLRWARDHGRYGLLDQCSFPGVLRRRILAEEASRWPGLRPGFTRRLAPGPLEEREESEWTLADRITAPSAFVADGLATCGVPPEKIRVVPYGVDLGHSEAVEPVSAQDDLKSRPLRVLFVGEIGLNKGAIYLLEALQTLGPACVQGRLVGRVAFDPPRLGPYREVAVLTGAVPRREITEHFEWADVFCLPSLAEGSALVIYEAIRAGLAIVTTKNAGSPIRDDIGGRLVPIRDSDAIAAALQAYRDDPEVLSRHRAEVARLRSFISLDAYGERVIAALGDLACRQQAV